MHLTRRDFLCSLGAVAATAVIAPSLVPYSSGKRAGLLDAMSGGFVENETFLFDGPVTLDLRENLVFRNCCFIWQNVEPIKWGMRVPGGSGISVFDCNFWADGAPCEVLLYFEPGANLEVSWGCHFRSAAGAAIEVS